MEAATTTVERMADRRGEARPSPRVPRLLWLAAIVACAAALAWISAVVATAGHGLDMTDEGYLLLSYRWWDTDLRTFTGIQYLYGPVFELLGYHIGGLRIFRLFTVVAVHLVFGLAFMRWLRERRPAAPQTRLWEFTGVAATLAAGGMVYGWLPLTAGYNDVSLLGSMLVAAVVLKTATRAGQNRLVSAWVPASLGPVMVVMVFGKWASALVTLGFVAVVLLVVLRPQGFRQVARFIALALAGALVTVALIHLLLIPLTTALPEMMAVNKLAATNTNSPKLLLLMYGETSFIVLTQILRTHALLFLAVALSLVSRHRLVQWSAGILAVAGLGWSTWQVVSDGGLAAGNGNLDRYPVSVLATLAVAVVAAVGAILRARLTTSPGSAPRHSQRRDWAVFAMLAVLPVAQAMGTGNPVYKMAVNGFAVWMAIIIAVLTSIEAAHRVTRPMIAAMTGAAVLMCAIVGINGVWQSPYRTAGRAQTTAAVSGVPPLASVKLDPATADRYSRFYQRLKPYVEPNGRAIMAFDEQAGVVFLLGGRSVGEAWYSGVDHNRAAEGIRSVCAGGHPWWGERKPLLLFSRPVTETEINALRSCGLDFATDYRLLASKEETMGLAVYVPAGEGAAGRS